MLLAQSDHSSEFGLLFGPGAHLLWSGNWPGRWLADSAHSVVFSEDQSFHTELAAQTRDQNLQPGYDVENLGNSLQPTHKVSLHLSIRSLGIAGSFFVCIWFGFCFCQEDVITVNHLAQ